MSSLAKSKAVKSCACNWGSTTGLSVPCPEPRVESGLLCRQCRSGVHTIHDRQVAAGQGLFVPAPWTPSKD